MKEILRSKQSCYFLLLHYYSLSNIANTIDYVYNHHYSYCLYYTAIRMALCLKKTVLPILSHFSVSHKSLHFAGYWNVFGNLGAVGRLRRKLKPWDMQEEVGFLQSYSVTGAPCFPTDPDEQKAHIFLQKLTGMGQHMKITRLPF